MTGIFGMRVKDLTHTVQQQQPVQLTYSLQWLVSDSHKANSSSDSASLPSPAVHWLINSKGHRWVVCKFVRPSFSYDCTVGCSAFSL